MYVILRKVVPAAGLILVILLLSIAQRSRQVGAASNRELFELGWMADSFEFSQAAAWGDVDNDGDLDLAVGNNNFAMPGQSMPNKLYLSQDGKLSKTAAWQAGQQTSTLSVAWGDYDNDGDLDLAVGNLHEPNQIYRNEQGQLTQQPVWSAPAAEHTHSLAWGDYDNDGDLDLLAGNGDTTIDYRGDNLRTCRNTTCKPMTLYANQGQSADSAPLFSAVWSPSDSINTTSVAWGDVDNDGDLDLAAGNAFQSLRVYYNDAGILSATASWSSLDKYPSSSVAWGDYDGDGDLDLVAGSLEENAPTRLYHNEGGALAPWIAWESAERDSATSVAWGDYDGDGDLDLATGNQRGPNRVYRTNNGSLDQAATWSTSVYEPTRAVLWADVDGNGGLDLTIINQNLPNKIYFNLVLPLSQSASWSSSVSDGSSSVAWGDVDGDGDLDLAAGYYSGAVKLYENSAGQLLSDPVWSGDQQSGDIQLAWGDVDVDGDLDLAVSSFSSLGAPILLYRNEGGRMEASPAWQSGLAESTSSLAWGDVDNDGDLDLAAGNHIGTDPVTGDRISSPLRLYRNDQGTLTSEPAWSSSETGSALSMAWGDIDGDGDLDLAAGNTGHPLRIYINDGGELRRSAAWSSERIETITSLAWGDADGDGDLDLAVGSSNNRIRIYANDKGMLQPLPSWSSREFNFIWQLAWGDVDNDGDLDLAAVTAAGSILLYRNEDGLLDTEVGWESTESYNRSVAWGDVDNDGDLDLALATSLGPVKLLLNARNQRPSNTHPRLLVERPSPSDDASAYSDPAILTGPTLPISYSLAGQANTPISRIIGEYSLDGGGKWLPATPTSDTLTSGLETVFVSGPSTYSVTTPLEIPAASVLTSTILITEPGVLADINVNVNVLHSRDEDLSMILIAPSGEQVTLVRNRGGEGDDFIDTTFDHNDGPPIGEGWAPFTGVFRPEETLERLTGTQVAGLWTLLLLDSSPGETGALLSWGLKIELGRVEQHSATTPMLIQKDGYTISTISLTSTEQIADVDFTLTISHTYVGDLLILLADRLNYWMPLVDRRGGDGDDFAGTVLDEAADNPITNAAAPFQGRYRPHDSLRALDNSSAAGDWTLVIEDTDSFGIADQGALISWGMTVTLKLGSLELSNALSAPIPDGQILSSTIVLSSSEQLNDIDIGLSLEHAQPEDVQIRLTAPWGESIVLADEQPLEASGEQIVFDDELPAPAGAGTRYRPKQALSRFANQPISGTWTLSISDRGAGVSGSLRSWSLIAGSKTNSVYTYTWDLVRDGLMGQSDNAVFRLTAIPAPQLRGGASPGAFKYGAFSSASLPFRLRGTQVRVILAGESEDEPVANAQVYRLPAGNFVGGRALANLAGVPFQSDLQGYLAGRSTLKTGDQLLALAPISATTAYTLYYTNGTPTTAGLDAFTVTQGGVQTIEVGAQHPLLLFNLSVSLEWDAHYDPAYLEQLKFNLERASQHLYDFTDGQVALGQVTVYQNADNWASSDVVIHATNRLRPFAAQGGVVLTPTLDFEHPQLNYTTGQVHMGASWERHGTPGKSDAGDWSAILAHELSHYLLFLDDTYLGHSADGRLIAVDSCTGSAMGDVYQAKNTEFIADELFWAAECDDTLSAQTLRRTEWQTLRGWYPDLIAPSAPLSGPIRMPFGLTTVSINAPMTATNALEDSFAIIYAENKLGTSEGRAFLVRGDETATLLDDYILDLGVPTIGQTRVLARSAQADDRLCVFDQGHRQFGCKQVVLDNHQLMLVADPAWTPSIQITPMTSQTIQLQVSGLPANLDLQARLYPEYGPGAPSLSLQETNGMYSGTVTLDYPGMAGHVQLWVDEEATESQPRREMIVGYSIGGNPGFMRIGTGLRRGGGFMRIGTGFMRIGTGPLLSPDGSVMFESSVDPQPDQLYALQNTAQLPALPEGKQLIGQGYNLTGSPSTSSLTGTISFQYLSSDLSLAGAKADNLRIHYWDGARWQVLPTLLNPGYNLASAHSQGSGRYALLAGQTTPQISGLTPEWATNALSTTLVISGDNFLDPVSVTLLGPAGAYPLTVQQTSQSLITATLAMGLPAGEYQLSVSNGDGAPASSTARFALYEPSDACFSDSFGSGAGKWTSTGSWGIVALPGGGKAMTDSPDGSYNSAPIPGTTISSTLTSAPFSLDGCASPLLHFRHDYVLAKLGGSQDSGAVQISSDGGVSWQTLVHYSGGGIYGPALDQPGDEWAHVSWKRVTINLSRYSGTVRLRFLLEVDATVADKGWMIDDVAVEAGRSRLYLPALFAG